jgi:DNA polymerase (family X)
VVAEYVTSGKSTLLDDLKTKNSPAAVFARVPGIGKELAERIADQLDIKTLPELEEAAHDNRLARVEGFGPRRIEAVQTALAGMLSQTARRTQQERMIGRKSKKDTEPRPSVELLLKIDEDYRKRAEAGELRKIAPRRFNPKNKAWLPVMTRKEDGWTFTALFSNTSQAHQLEKTDDWVVIYYKRDGKERQNTVVTETQGALKGKRVVRGRALENERYYGATVS